MLFADGYKENYQKKKQDNRQDGIPLCYFLFKFEKKCDIERQI